MWFVVLTVQNFTALVIFLTIDTVISLIGILTKDFNKAFGFVGVVLFLYPYHNKYMGTYQYA